MNQIAPFGNKAKRSKHKAGKTVVIILDLISMVNTVERTALFVALHQKGLPEKLVNRC